MTALAVPRPAGLPTRAAPRGDEPLTTLLEAQVSRWTDARGGLTPPLVAWYGGDLRIPLHGDRPTVVANFAETLDGVVAMDVGGRTGGGEISGFSPTDRFLMGILRALADVVLVGGAVARRSRNVARTPGAVAPDAASALAELRTSLGLPKQPTTLILTASGDLDPALPGFAGRDAPVVIAAPGTVATRLRRAGFGPNVAVEALSGGDDGNAGAGAGAALELAGRLGARLVVSEAGPRILGDLLRAGRVDELFLTLSPQLAGRGPGERRLGLVEGAALWPGLPTWARLASVRRGGDHLYLRFQLEEPNR
jgi:riboflavin biosynthesis pyrimidine reductase